LPNDARGDDAMMHLPGRMRRTNEVNDRQYPPS
jgi:hypothetical protein